MMATDHLPSETDGDIELTTPKKAKRGKRYNEASNINGVIENGHDSAIESTSSRKPKQFETRRVDESTLEPSTRSEPTDEAPNRNSTRSNQQLTPLQSYQSNPLNFQQVELTTVTDDEEPTERRSNIQPRNRNVTDHDTMVSSYTTNDDNDVIEIHEFSLADADAYIDIYFDTLNNRLRHFIGTDDQLQQFRLALKNRINSETNSREYQNALLGKMNGDVVAAVMLSFPSEPTTVLNDNILPQPNSCVTSLRRWMVRNANYTPTNMDECYIEMIGVRSAFRNHGIGAAMLECVEHFARQAGARLLTVHVNSEQLRGYFQRFNFQVDHSDNSAFWKWVVERESILKMSKPISPDEEGAGNQLDDDSNYLAESTIGS
ncbi:unnamed protein product [Adineta ricciae]|uniref:N-acetyltransferase domain-containing protein n=1 Tax=Adineta ricciae TaxID=249248 RepID=A0A813MYP9_ADIRI|nr:unnamed protein product [Adineta ricciae]CAF0931388.1 unnamed protein product [Adineta ricciae]